MTTAGLVDRQGTARVRAARVPRARAKIIHPSELMDKNARTLGALTEIGSRHALIGGLVAGYYGKGRATEDVDLLVPERSMKRMQAAIEQRGYEVRTLPDRMRMHVPGETASVGDLFSQEANSVLRAAFSATTPATMLGLPVSMVARATRGVQPRRARGSKRGPKHGFRGGNAPMP